ncbi:MAG: hypothetical protein VST67_07085 [Nitrospirota bacterium]|nr:hypothetical protein [Nitrospirota bacterium]
MNVDLTIRISAFVGIFTVRAMSEMMAPRRRIAWSMKAVPSGTDGKEGK